MQTKAEKKVRKAVKHDFRNGTNVIREPGFERQQKLETKMKLKRRSHRL